MVRPDAGAAWMRSFALGADAASFFAQDAPKPRNAIIFVADGLRHGSVNPTDTPALYRVRTARRVLRQQPFGVSDRRRCRTAAAIATGHYPGDTGQFANQIFIAYPLFDSGNFGQARGTMVPDVEDPLVLADINDHFGGNYLREASIVAFARSYGYNTAVDRQDGSRRLPRTCSELDAGARHAADAGDDHYRKCDRRAARSAVE